MNVVYAALQERGGGVCPAAADDPIVPACCGHESLRLGGGTGREPAAGEHRQIGEAVGHEAVVDRSNDTAPHERRIADEPFQIGSPTRIKTTEWIVEHEHLRIVEQAAGHQQALRLSHREPVDALLPALLESRQRERLADRRGQRLAGEAGGSGEEF